MVPDIISVSSASSSSALLNDSRTRVSCYDGTRRVVLRSLTNTCFTSLSSWRRRLTMACVELHRVTRSEIRVGEYELIMPGSPKHDRCSQSKSYTALLMWLPLSVMMQTCLTGSSFHCSKISSIACPIISAVWSSGMKQVPRLTCCSSQELSMKWSVKPTYGVIPRDDRMSVVDEKY